MLPGVGAFRDAINKLNATGLGALVVSQALAGKPLLGICLGMQILFEHSEEDGGVDLLGILPGRVRRFPAVKGCKVPQMGWNSVSGPGFNGEEYYFVHSYFAPVGPRTTGVSDYAGVEFTAAAERGNIAAVQFHPEKSGRIGLAFLKRFLSRNA